MKKVFRFTFVLLLSLGLVTGNVCAWSKIAPSGWAAPEVRASIDSGLPDVLFWGDESDQGSYTDPITRTQFCTMIAAIIGKSKDLDAEVQAKQIKEKGYINPFTDVSENTFGNLFIGLVHSLGIVDGVSGTQFDPQGVLTREQAAKILSEVYAYLKPGVWQDHFDYLAGKNVSDSAKISSWAKPYVGFAMEQDLINGMGDGTFAPKEPYTVEQAMSTCYRLCNTLSIKNMVSVNTNAWIDQYGLTRGDYTLGAMRLAYDNHSDLVTALTVNAIHVEGQADLAVSAMENQDAFAAYLGQADWLRTDDAVCHYYMATADLTLTLKDGTTKNVTDKFCFMNDGGV